MTHFDKPKEFEHFSNPDAVCAYLKGTNREELCADFEQHDPTRIEAALVQDLTEALARQPFEQEEVDAIRSHIYYTSYFSYPPTTVDETVELVQKLEGASDEQRKFIQHVLTTHVCGEEIEPAVRTAEIYAKSEELRPLRDRLYYQRLYERWCEVGKIV